MSRLFAAIAGMCILGAIGCGSTSDGPQVTPPADPVASYAQSIRKMVEDIQISQQGAEGEDPQAVVPAVNGFVENLEGWESAPVGDHRQTYVDLQKAAKELQSLLEKSKWNADCAKKLAEMAALTEKLPGKK